MNEQTQTPDEGSLSIPQDNPALASAMRQTPEPTGISDDGVVDTLGRPGGWDVVTASWDRETIIGQLTRAAGIAPEVGEASPNFNPYTYALQNEDEFGDILSDIADGGFDGVRSESAFRQKAKVARLNRADLETLQKAGPGFGNMALQMGASLFDITSIVSFGAAAKVANAGRIANAARGAAVGVADGLAQEALLGSMDPTRRADEAFMNVGMQASILAGFGALSKHAAPSNALLPDHPRNPLAPENLGLTPQTVEVKFGQTFDEGVTVGSGDHAGAMRASTVDDSAYARASGWRGAVADSVEKVLGWGTPIARLRHYDGPGRQVLTQLVDLGGRLTKGMAEGRAGAPEAEAFRTVYMQQSRMAQNDVQSIYRETLMSLGQSRTSAAVNEQTAQFGAILRPGLGDNNAVTHEVFNKAIFDDLSARQNNNVRAELEIKADLKAAGHSNAEIDTIYAGVLKGSQRFRKVYDDFSDDLVKHGLMDAKDVRPGYMPVIYTRSGINDDPQGMEDLLLRLLVKQPTDEFLDDHLKTLVERTQKADGSWDEKPMFKDIDALKKDEKAFGDAVRLWSDESERSAMDAAEAAYSSAQTKFAAKIDELDMIGEGIEGWKKDKRTATLREARARTTLAEAGYHGRATGYAQARAVKAEQRLAELQRDYPDFFDLAAHADGQFQKTGQALSDSIDPMVSMQGAVKDVGALESSLRGTRRAETRAGRLERGSPEHADITRQIDEANAEVQRTRTERDIATAKFDEAARAHRDATAFREEAVKTAEQAAKDAETAAGRSALEARMDADADRISLLKEKLAAAEDAKRAVNENLSLAYKGKKLSAAEMREAAREVRRTGRLNKRMKNATPLTQYVREITTALRGQDRYPGGMLLDNAPDSGRLKQRHFDWTPELWGEASKRGFVETDPQVLADRYARDMAGRLALQRSVGTQNVEELLASARDHYDDAVRRTTDPKKVKQLLATRDANLKDIRASYDRLMGKHEANDDTAVGWIAGTLGKIGYLRFGGGFGLAALGDLGTAVFSQRGFLKGIAAHTGAYKELVGLAKTNEGSRQLLALLQSFETGAHMQTSPRAIGSRTARDHLGFGSGSVRDASVAADKLMTILGNKVNTLSGLGAISDGTRRIAGFVQIANLQRWLDRGLDASGKFDYQKLSRQQRHDLASLNIGEREAAQMAKLMRKHGTQHDKLFDPGLSGWAKEPNGDAMIGLFNTAMVKAQQRASYTQGFGNMPLMMDNAIGKLLFQFQSQAFQFTNNFLVAGLQRGALDESFVRMATALGVSVAMATLVTVARNQMRAQPEDLSTWDGAKWGWTLVQRTGILGWSGQYVDSFNKLAGDSINNALGVKVIDPGSKFSQNDWLASLVGPWKGVLDNVGATGSSLVRGEFSKAHEKAFQLVPLNQQLQALSHAAKAITN
jgi:hypothetical protein